MSGVSHFGVAQNTGSVAASQICRTADSLLVGKLVVVAVRRSRNPMARKIASDRFSYRDDPYRRDSHRTFSQSNTCKNCKRPGHFARECPNVSICHNCGLPGHNLSECSAKSVCWNCREPGHMSNSCTNEGICHSCAEERRPRGIRAQYREEEVVCRNCRQVGHMSRDCTARLMICRNCGGRGHIAYECPSGRLVNHHHHHHYPLRY
ncbi:hypothetical protein F2Q70_00033615 [Brassica cretica]|uniref:CCHC-type domain-containing protein n=1 Tax=Brassica cretica TaxID=69181 RepID=A0A8S9FIR1_BRACR|nr:hypothetical protein F2Q70_00033615 [Brassica cretica]